MLEGRIAGGETPPRLQSEDVGIGSFDVFSKIRCVLVEAEVAPQKRSKSHPTESVVPSFSGLKDVVSRVLIKI